LGQSAYARDLCSFKDGAPPPVDLNAERRNGAFLRGLIASGRVSVAHDLSDGGLGVALVEMALAGNIGVKLKQLPQGPTHAALFGEDQARYLIAVAPETVRADPWRSARGKHLHSRNWRYGRGGDFLAGRKADKLN